MYNNLHRSLSMQQHGSGRILIEKLSGMVWRTVFSVVGWLEDAWSGMSIDDLSETYVAIHPYWHHSSINSLHAWLLKITTDRSHHGSTPSVVLRNGSRVASIKPTVAPGWFRIEPLDWSASIGPAGLPAGSGRILADAHYEQLRKCQKALELSGIRT